MRPRAGAKRALAAAVVCALGVWGGPARARPQEDPVREAILAIERGDGAAAVALLEGVVAAGLEDPRALFYLGRAYLLIDRPDDAVRALRRAGTRGEPGSVPVAFWLGVALMRAGDLAGARERLEAVLVAEPGSVPARLQLAWLDLLQDRPAAAVRALEALAGERPDDPTVWYYLGLSRHGTADIDGALGAYERALEQDPSMVPARVALGRAKVEAGDAAGAVATLQQALANEPANADALFELGRLRLREGRLEEATSLLERAVAASPEHAAARYQLGLAYGAAGRDAESAAMLADHAALEEPERRAARRGREAAAASTTWERGRELLAAGRAAEAAAAFRAVIDATGEGTTAAAYLALGAACLQAEDAACAAGALQEAVTRDPRMAVAHLLHSEALRALGRDDEAGRALAEYRRLVGPGRP